ncbi:hypothetical protein [Ralstonia phage RSP15]|uniref:hypothetical protein n=1 Tax=Ralstonia phage RSP15 TaxID=1785960 RepID=UPI00074D4CD2|nr:hypothetical protein BH754_gp046 [Ralstonia phage RSP15]BAU40004.1 hypothetical protein [Ralstonia phage RSP15]
MSVLNFIRANSDWDEQVKKIGSRYDPTIKIPNLVYDAHEIDRELAIFFRVSGEIQPWQSRPDVPNRNMSGGCLTYNPAYPKEEWLTCGFGNKRYQHLDNTTYFTAVNKDTPFIQKDDYLDIHTFRKMHPHLEQVCPHLTKTLNGFKVPLVNVNVRVIHGQNVSPTSFSTKTGGMHKDQSPFTAVRANMYISTDGNYGLEYENGDLIMPGAGENFVVNTDVPHRAYIKDWNMTNRVNIVLNMLPWLDYDSEDDSWSFNEYYGKIHPYDMIREGLFYG